MVTRGKIYQSLMPITQIAIMRDQIAITSGKHCVIASLKISTTTEHFSVLSAYCFSMMALLIVEKSGKHMMVLSYRLIGTLLKIFW